MHRNIAKDTRKEHVRTTSDDVLRPKTFTKRRLELAQIRDDMLEITEVTLYLFTLK